MVGQGREQKVTQSEAPLTSGLLQRTNPQEHKSSGHASENSVLQESIFQINLATVPVQCKPGTPETTSNEETKRPNKTGLPGNLKAGLEHLSGLDMSDVRVHYNSSKPANLNALAYAQGTDIYVGPGHEKHLPHEGWHVIQQMQGRVQSTPQKQGSIININNDQELEHEAEILGAKAIQISSQGNHFFAPFLYPNRRNASPLNSSPQSCQQGTKLTTSDPQLPIQLYLNDEGRLPEDEKTLDGFLKENGFDSTLFSKEAYQRFGQAFEIIRGLDEKYSDEAIYGRTRLEAAYDALLEDCQTEDLEEGQPARISAIQAGADHYEKNNDVAEAARTQWPGRGPVPQQFADDIQKERDNREAKVKALKEALKKQTTKEIDQAYSSYTNDDKLLPGTINEIKIETNRKGKSSDLTTVKETLEKVYKAQCKISRQNWLIHLGVAGNRINGSNNLHYTTFNDSIVEETEIPLVDEKTVEEICNKLFASVVRVQRLHATHVNGNDRTHRYWGDPPTNNNPLDKEYDRMVKEITQKVKEAKDKHGRVAHNDRGQQLKIQIT